MKRWYVERTRDNFEDVGAKYMTVDGGTLIFHDEPLSPTDSLVIAYAAGQWITVFAEEEQ